MPVSSELCVFPVRLDKPLQFEPWQAKSANPPGLPAITRPEQRKLMKLLLPVSTARPAVLKRYGRTCTEYSSPQTGATHADRHGDFQRPPRIRTAMSVPTWFVFS